MSGMDLANIPRVSRVKDDTFRPSRVIAPHLGCLSRKRKSAVGIAAVSRYSRWLEPEYPVEARWTDHAPDLISFQQRSNTKSLKKVGRTVFVPSAAWHCQSPTDAPEPLLEPPGVLLASKGLEVTGPLVVNANSVVCFSTSA